MQSNKCYKNIFQLPPPPPLFFHEYIKQLIASFSIQVCQCCVLATQCYIMSFCKKKTKNQNFSLKQLKLKRSLKSICLNLVDAFVTVTTLSSVYHLKYQEDTDSPLPEIKHYTARRKLVRPQQIIRAYLGKESWSPSKLVVFPLPVFRHSSEFAHLLSSKIPGILAHFLWFPIWWRRIQVLQVFS